MSKIIMIFGMNGTGKSTLAVNLALALYEQGKSSILLPAELSFGGLQVFFGEFIPPQTGFMEGYLKGTLADQFQKTKMAPGISILGVPNENTAVVTELFDTEVLDEKLITLSRAADFLIIDGISYLNNPLTAMGLIVADVVICTYHPSIRQMMWHQSVGKHIPSYISGDIWPVLSNHNRSCNPEEFEKEIPLRFLLPEVESVEYASYLECTGTPIYKDKKKSSKQYRKQVNQMAFQLIEGGDEVG